MKVLAITGIRSDYDLMSSLYRELENDPAVQLKLLVGGAHLSNTFGYSVRQIEDDGFDVLLRVESLLDSNSKSARLKHFSNFLAGSIDTVVSFSPDLIIYAGDREDVMMGALLGGYLNIPTIHFYSGDHVADGHIDNPVRHATAKLSTAHVVMLEEHKKRLLAIGEEPGRVYVAGNLSLDKFVGFKPMQSSEVNSILGLDSSFQDYALVIFHPTQEDKKEPAEIFRNILDGLLDQGIRAFVSYPNIDPGNYEIRKVLEEYRKHNNFYFYKNLDRDVFLSVYKRSRFIIGNSSSGVCEAASLPIPAINVGTRQTGRHAAENVLFVDSSKNEIVSAIQKVTDDGFLRSISSIKNPYGDGDSVDRAYSYLKENDFKSLLLKKADPIEINK